MKLPDTISPVPYGSRISWLSICMMLVFYRIFLLSKAWSFKDVLEGCPAHAKNIYLDHCNMIIMSVMTYDTICNLRDALDAPRPLPQSEAP